MGQDHNDCKRTFVRDLVRRRTNVSEVATGRKSALLSVIGCRTDRTYLAGVMEEAEGYENITVFSDVKQ